MKACDESTEDEAVDEMNCERTEKKKNHFVSFSTPAPLQRLGTELHLVGVCQEKRLLLRSGVFEQGQLITKPVERPCNNIAPI